MFTVEGDDPQILHETMAATMDTVLARIREIQRAAREDGDLERKPWPMILMVTPKGWTGPKFIDGLQYEGTWRSHQVPLTATRENAEHRRMLQEWMESYRPARAVRRRGPGDRADRRAGPGR